MAIIEIIMPQMGESVMEATIISWLKKEGERVEEEEPLLEVATDKVDTEVPAAESGVITKLLAKEGDVVQIGAPIAVIDTDGAETKTVKKEEPAPEVPEQVKALQEEAVARQSAEILSKTETIPAQVVSFQETSTQKVDKVSHSMAFYSPLVRKIAKEENISLEELATIAGTGKSGRVTKNDVLAYLKNRPEKERQVRSNGTITDGRIHEFATAEKSTVTTPLIKEGDEVIEMDRVRRIIAERMVESRNISAHVHSFVEADVTRIVRWKKKVQDHFLKDLGVKLTYTPIFIEAVVKALQDFPMMNISVHGTKIIKKKRINIGLAVAMPDGNLIVPVIKNADQLNIVGLAKQVNDYAYRARHNQLKPEEVRDSTYTITNVGSFGSTMGTPIILQPNVGILAIGVIEKKPVVIESKEYGDVIAIRHMMVLSHSYDHRVIDGALGSLFVKRVGEYLQNFDDTRVF